MEENGNEDGFVPKTFSTISTFVPKPPTTISTPDHRPRSYPTHGGPGMQAIFLDSSKRPRGTGVFLPRRTGKDFQPNKKPACSPVLLPSRVVRTLNLNVHELETKTKLPRDKEHGSTSINRKATINKKGKKDPSSSKYCVISYNSKTSPDIYLPKEWTY